jgi:putative nucleotidyltransferase with HDIG domain
MDNVMERARQLTDKVGDLPPMPVVILRALELLNDPSSSIHAVQAQIQPDQALTAFMLKAANSPLYGVLNPVSTLSQTIRVLGFSTSRTLLLSYLSRRYLQQKGSRMIQNLMWQHSLASAVFAKKAAEYLRRPNSEEAFIAALLHDIGKSVLINNATEAFERTVEFIYNLGWSSVVAEQDVFGYTHVEVGYLVMRNWRFSDAVIESLIHHHAPLDFSGENLLVPLVSLANKMAHRFGFAFSEAAPEIVETAALNLDPEAVPELGAQARNEIEQYLELFGR